MGSSKTPKQEVSQEERTQSAQAVAKWNERIDDGYLDLESEVIGDARRDHSGLIGGRIAGDIAAAEQAAYQTGLSSGNPTYRNLSSTGDAVSSALAVGNVDAQSEAQKLRDQKMLGAVNLGQDVAITSQNALRTTANNASSRALNSVQNDILKSNSRTQAALTALQGLGSGLTLRSAGYQLNAEGLQRKDTNGKVVKDLGWAGAGSVLASNV